MVHRLAAALSSEGPKLIEQRDTFFVTPRGRLKLREFKNGTAELIFYERPDTEEPTPSVYSLVPVSEPAALRDALEAALGIRGVVNKRRTLYLAGETRIHIDDVDGLGAFLELEVVLETGHGASTHEEGMARCRSLMSELDIPERDLIDRAYIDLLEEASE